MSVIIRMRVGLCMEVPVTQKITPFELPETKTFTLSTKDQRSRSYIKMSPNWVIGHMYLHQSELKVSVHIQITEEMLRNHKTQWLFTCLIQRRSRS